LNKIMSKIIEVPLTQGQTAIIDEADAERVLVYKWFASKDKTYSGGGKFVAKRNVVHKGKRTVESMHKFIMNTPESLCIDHIDRNPLNNTRKNLRLSTKAENLRNRSKQVNNKSGYKGVCWNKQAQKYHAQITHKGKRIHLGYYRNAEDAARVYDLKAKELFGEFAYLNFSN